MTCLSHTTNEHYHTTAPPHRVQFTAQPVLPLCYEEKPQILP